MLFCIHNLLTLALFLVCLSYIDGLKDAEIKNGKVEELKLSTGQFIIRKRMTQTEGMHHCEKRSEGGRLVVLPTQAEAEALVKAIHDISHHQNADDPQDLTHEFGMSRRYWVGLTDLPVEGEWLWINEGSYLHYDFWYPGQPDHLDNHKSEHCVTLWNPIYFNKELHSFNDEKCDNKHYTICEDHAPAKKADKH